MAIEMPERVLPVTGAVEVDFPWDRASAVLVALNDVITTVTAQLELRPGMLATLGDWEGWYRNDFDEKHTGMTTTASGLLESAAHRAGAVVTAADAANTAQRRANRDVEARVVIANAKLL